jgi:hypothetical protein
MAEECLSKQRTEVEDTIAEVNVVEREHKCMVLTKHRVNDGAEKHR